MVLEAGGKIVRTDADLHTVFIADRFDQTKSQSETVRLFPFPIVCLKNLLRIMNLLRTALDPEKAFFCVALDADADRLTAFGVFDRVGDIVVDHPLELRFVKDDPRRIIGFEIFKFEIGKLGNLIEKFEPFFDVFSQIDRTDRIVDLILFDQITQIVIDTENIFDRCFDLRQVAVSPFIECKKFDIRHNNGKRRMRLMDSVADELFMRFQKPL